jgi:hypothetical protein
MPRHAGNMCSSAFPKIQTISVLEKWIIAAAVAELRRGFQRMVLPRVLVGIWHHGSVARIARRACRRRT